VSNDVSAAKIATPNRKGKTTRQRPAARKPANVKQTGKAKGALAARTQATRKPKPTAKSELTKKYGDAVKRKKKEMTDWVWGNRPHASYTELVFHPQVKQKPLREDAYSTSTGQNQSKAVQVSGIGKAGSLQLTVLNNVSGHDLWRDGSTEASYKAAIDQRVKGDRVRVSIRFPDGSSKILKDGVQSKDVTAVDLSVQLKKGKNFIFVDRTNASGGIVGSSGALAGRGVEVQWDGN